MNQSSTTHILSLLLALMLSLAVVRIVLIPTDVENAPLKNSHRDRNNNNSSNRSVNNADTNHNISTKFPFDPNTNTNNSAVALNLIGFENDYREYASSDSDAQAYAREKHKTGKTIDFDRIELVDDAIPSRTQDEIGVNIIATAIDDRGNSNHSQNIDVSSEKGDSMMRTQSPANERKRHLKQRLMQHSDADLNGNNRRSIRFRRYAMNFYVVLIG